MLALMADTVPLLGQVVVQHSTPEVCVAAPVFEISLSVFMQSWSASAVMNGYMQRQRHPPQDHTATGRGGAAATNAHSKPAAIARASTTGDAGVQAVLGPSLLAVLFRQLPRLLRVAQPWHALSLASLSVVEALLVARSESLLAAPLGDQASRYPSVIYHCSLDYA